MTDLDEDVESNFQEDKWRKKATTTARYDLCYKCEFYTPQKPYKPGVRCRFGYRPDVKYIEGKAIAKCHVFKSKEKED